jgi:hypothetical protein
MPQHVLFKEFAVMLNIFSFLNLTGSLIGCCGFLLASLQRLLLQLLLATPTWYRLSPRCRATVPTKSVDAPRAFSACSLWLKSWPDHVTTNLPHIIIHSSVKSLVLMITWYSFELLICCFLFLLICCFLSDKCVLFSDSMKLIVFASYKATLRWECFDIETRHVFEFMRSWLNDKLWAKAIEMNWWKFWAQIYRIRTISDWNEDECDMVNTAVQVQWKLRSDEVS